MGTPDRRSESVWSLKEHDRFKRQILVDRQKSLDERRKKGQFSTPYPIAHEIMSSGLKFLGDRQEFKFLEPAVGTGVFFSALMDLTNGSGLKKAVGYEIDNDYGDISRNLWGTTLEIRSEDFTTADSDIEFDLLITNPPYVRHHLIPTDLKTQLNTLAYNQTNISLSGLSGLYCYFLLLADRWLKPNAICGWLIPSEFMDVNYGEGLKKYLLNNVKLLKIHQYDPDSTLFSDALVSSAVVFFENIKTDQDYEIEFSFGKTLSSPEMSVSVNKSTLEKETKWTRIMCNRKCEKDASETINDFFEIKRGLATGDNKFFILDEQSVQKLGLDMDYLQPILPSPRYLKTDNILSDTNGLPMLDKKYFLLNCKLDENEIQDKYPELWNYLKSGKDTAATRYLCKCRKKWYFQETRTPAPILCTYMGRNSKNAGPFHFIRNNSKAVATNSYLMLYPKKEIADIIKKQPELMDLIWNYLNALSSEALENEGRAYGGGLKKIEPKELGNVPCPDLGNIIYQKERLSTPFLSKIEEFQNAYN